jgi:hypothetical protein
VRISAKTLQLTLIFIALLLIITTYFYIPKVKQNKLEEETAQKKEAVDEMPGVENIFENVSYEGIYQIDNTFIITADRAKILAEDPNIVYMNNMHVTIILQSGQKIIITSDSGRYNKLNYDIFFEDNVNATDNEIRLFSDNLDLLADESAKVYNNVLIIDKEKSYLKADIVKYDFETKYYKISMFTNSEKVKVKLIE